MLDKHNLTSERVALSSLVTAACYVIKCVQMRYCCPTPGLPLNSKYDLVRRELQQKPVKFFFFFFQALVWYSSFDVRAWLCAE